MASIRDVSELYGKGYGALRDTASAGIEAYERGQAILDATKQKVKDELIGGFRSGAGMRDAPEQKASAAIPYTTGGSFESLAPAVVQPQAIAPQVQDTARANNIVSQLNQSTGGFDNAGFEPVARGPDLSDLNAIRERVVANGEKTGNGASLITLKVLNDIANKRWQSYNTARGNDIQELTSMGGLAQRNRATDIQQQVADLNEGLKNLPDREKELASYYRAIATDMNQPPEVKQDAQLRFRALMEAGDDVNARALEQLTARGIMSEGATGGGFAEGGEVDVEYEVEMDMPEAVPTGEVQMDSGDYVIPVEAMRFYGRKFFQDLITKAEDSDME